MFSEISSKFMKRPDATRTRILFYLNARDLFARVFIQRARTRVFTIHRATAPSDTESEWRNMRSADGVLCCWLYIGTTWKQTFVVSTDNEATGAEIYIEKNTRSKKAQD